MERHRGLLLGPRLGLDAGSARTRVRLTVDVYGDAHRSDVGYPPAGWEPAIGFELAVLSRL